MKNIKGFTLGLVLGLSTAIGGMALAQSNTQADPNKRTESCCCMSSGSGSSCPMMKEGAMKSDKHECCCCGDSCDMKDMKHRQDMKMKDMKSKP